MIPEDFFGNDGAAAIEHTLNELEKRNIERPQMLLVQTLHEKGGESLDTIFGMRVTQTPLVRAPLIGVMLTECRWCRGHFPTIFCPRCHGSGIASFAVMKKE